MGSTNATFCFRKEPKLSRGAQGRIGVDKQCLNISNSYAINLNRAQALDIPALRRNTPARRRRQHCAILVKDSKVYVRDLKKPIAMDRDGVTFFSLMVMRPFSCRATPHEGGAQSGTVERSSTAPGFNFVARL